MENNIVIGWFSLKMVETFYVCDPKINFLTLNGL